MAKELGLKLHEVSTDIKKILLMASLHLPVPTIVIDHSREPNSCHFEWCVIGRAIREGNTRNRMQRTLKRDNCKARRIGTEGSIVARQVVNISMYATLRNSYEFVCFYAVLDTNWNYLGNDTLAPNKNCIISRIHCVSFFQGKFRLPFTLYFVYYFIVTI